MKNNISIAIDGPVGSGKGTLAVALAKKINALYVYTGAMYRELALACSREKIDVTNEEQILNIFNKISIRLEPKEKGIRAFLDNEDVSDKIFQPNISNLTPVVAAFPKVREAMVLKQKKLILDAALSGRSVVMEGRDISTKVMPDADLKIYLTASIETRARRRLKQFEGNKVKVDFEQVLLDLKERDRMDMERKASPLSVAPDAYVLDTTDLSVEETVNKVVEKLKEKRLL
ncbi:MAG: (d)CMP kinase [Candidatus Levybacteria bacterium]|nr:(d)CMP kinase [Candidatus Levybacteria bacterium]MDZ4227934.1 (d)CMP kinase [Candidatus Levybacteria bacterium]